MAEKGWGELKIMQRRLPCGERTIHFLSDSKSLVHSTNLVSFSSGDTNIQHDPTNLPSETLTQLEESSRKNDVVVQ